METDPQVASSWGREEAVNLAGSRQQVQLDIGVSQAIEIHGLEALERGVGKRAMSSQLSLPPAEWILGMWRAAKKGYWGWG